MRWARTTLAVLATGLLLALPAAPSHASCVGHTPMVEPATTRAGQQVVLRGEYWFVGCFDTDRVAASPPTPPG